MCKSEHCGCPSPDMVNHNGVCLDIPTATYLAAKAESTSNTEGETWIDRVDCSQSSLTLRDATLEVAGNSTLAFLELKDKDGNPIEDASPVLKIADDAILNISEAVHSSNGLYTATITSKTKATTTTVMWVCNTLVANERKSQILKAQIETLPTVASELETQVENIESVVVGNKGWVWITLRDMYGNYLKDSDGVTLELVDDSDTATVEEVLDLQNGKWVAYLSDYVEETVQVRVILNFDTM